MHTENELGNHCATKGEHTCPSRCIHCHGPHAADDTKCELRPKAIGPPLTKTQVSAVRKINADARLRKQAEAGCVKPAANSTPTQNRAATPAASGQTQPTTIKSINPYEVLIIEDQSMDQVQSQ